MLKPAVLKEYIEYGSTIIWFELIISVIACCVSYYKRKSIARLIAVFLCALGICNFLSLVAFPIPVKVEYPIGHLYDFKSQFSSFDISSMLNYFPDILARDSRYISAPFILALFSPVLFLKLRKAVMWLISLAGIETTYLAYNIAVNTIAKYTMTYIDIGQLLFIAVGYSAGWVLSVLILRSFPIIDAKIAPRKK